MSRPRALSLLEAAANVLVGYALAVATQFAVFPAFDLRATTGQSLALGAVFSGVSPARSYALRRLFDRLGRRGAGGPHLHGIEDGDRCGEAIFDAREIGRGVSPAPAARKPRKSRGFPAEGPARSTEPGPDRPRPGKEGGVDMRGRKPKPAALKLLDGNPGKRPIRGVEPRPPGGKPSCPAHLSPTAKAEWKRLAGALHQVGLLTSADRAALAAYCQAYGRWVEAEKKPAETPPILRTPAARARLAVQIPTGPKPWEFDPAAEFIG